MVQKPSDRRKLNKTYELFENLQLTTFSEDICRHNLAYRQAGLARGKS